MFRLETTALCARWAFCPLSGRGSGELTGHRFRECHARAVKLGTSDTRLDSVSWEGLDCLGKCNSVLLGTVLIHGEPRWLEGPSEGV